MKEEFNVPIKFRGYKIKKIEYFVDQNDKKNSDNEVSFTEAISNDKRHGKVNVLVDFNNEKDTYGHVEVEGYFDFIENLSDMELAGLIKQNGCAMLYPYVRTIISMITALDADKVGILPTISFIDLNKKE